MIKIMPARTAGSHTGARIRYIIYAGGLESQVAIVSPGELGGLKSPEYMALHPGGKMPLLVLPTGQALPEATVRVRFRCPRRSMPATHPTTAHRGSSDAGNPRLPAGNDGSGDRTPAGNSRRARGRCRGRAHN